MQEIKIIFFDIDGTLVDMQKKQISEKTVEALRKLKKNGIKICIATGRPRICLPRFEGVEFDAYVTFNGSYCYDSQRAIFSNPMAGEDVQRLIQNAAEIGRPVSVATADRVVANGWDQDLSDYFALAHQELKAAPDFEAACQEPIYQIMLGYREEDRSALLAGTKGVKITTAWERAADVIPAKGGKGLGIQKLLEHYGLDKSQALAFGDGNNDIEMFQAVGTGIAMGNATPNLKAVAKDHCGHVAQDGIYHYCLEHKLI